MSQVLPKPFSRCCADRFPAVAAHHLHGLDVFIDPVLLEQPVTLTGVTGEHLHLDFADIARVHHSRRMDVTPKRSLPSIASA